MGEKSRIMPPMCFIAYSKRLSILQNVADVFVSRVAKAKLTRALRENLERPITGAFGVRAQVSCFKILV